MTFVVRSKPTLGRDSYNYGWVAFTRVDAAQHALESLQGTVPLRMEYSSRTEFPRSYTHPQVPDGDADYALQKIKAILRNDMFSSSVLHVSNIPKTAGTEDIGKIFHLGSLGGPIGVTPGTFSMLMLVQTSN
jgi:hypothetical protein